MTPEQKSILEDAKVKLDAHGLKTTEHLLATAGVLTVVINILKKDQEISEDLFDQIKVDLEIALTRQAKIEELFLNN